MMTLWGGVNCPSGMKRCDPSKFA